MSRWFPADDPSYARERERNKRERIAAYQGVQFDGAGWNIGSISFGSQWMPVECGNCGQTFDALVDEVVMAKDKFDLPVPCCSEACKAAVEKV